MTGVWVSIQQTGLRRFGMGIVSMKERAFLALGEFSIHSRPGQGTEVRVFVAFPKEALGSQLSSIQHRLQPDNVSSTPLKKP